MSFIVWQAVFCFLIPLTSASIIDDSYSSHEDVYDALLNVFFPIIFVVLLNVSGRPGPTKNVMLPLLDDILYNTVTWAIPLLISFSYNDLLSIRIFSITNMGLHVLCAAIALIRHKLVSDVINYVHSLTDRGWLVNQHLDAYIWTGTSFFLICFPVMAIPVFWIDYITNSQ